MHTFLSVFWHVMFYTWDSRKEQGEKETQTQSRRKGWDIRQLKSGLKYAGSVNVVWSHCSNSWGEKLQRSAAICLPGLCCTEVWCGVTITTQCTQWPLWDMHVKSCLCIHTQNYWMCIWWWRKYWARLRGKSINISVFLWTFVYSSKINHVHLEKRRSDIDHL